MDIDLDLGVYIEIDVCPSHGLSQILWYRSTHPSPFSNISSHYYLTKKRANTWRLAMPSSLAAQPTLAVGAEPFLLTGPDVKYIFRGCVAFILAAFIFMKASSNSKVSTNVPLINPGWSFDLANWGWRWYFAFCSQDLLKKGQDQCKGRAFKLMTDSGEIIVLPSSLVSNVSHEDKLVLRESVAEDFHAHIPGFEPFAAGTRDDQIGQGVVRKRLTRALSKYSWSFAQESCG